MSDKNARQFIDTNVLVYAHDTSAGIKHETAKSLIADLWDSANGCLSIQVLQEFYVSVTRKVAKPLGGEAAAKIVQNLSLWKIYVPNVIDVNHAIEIHQRYVISFWDAKIIQSALQLGCTTVLSEDLNDGQVYSGVQVSNPFRLLTADKNS